MISVEEFHRLTQRAAAAPEAAPQAPQEEHEESTGEVLIRALQASPHCDIEIEPERGFRPPVRDVDL